jgi:hypothetical protein
MSMALITAFALTPGWWIVVAVAIVVVLAVGYGMSTKRGSGITPREYRRPTAADSQPGAYAPAQVTGRDVARQAWERSRRARARNT